MYQCGPTVQSAPHIGHIRSGMVFDVLSRWLRAIGYDVTLCRNVTDIDDKILNKAVEEDREWWAVTADYERQFQAAYTTLGCTPPTVEPRATGHVTQMIDLIQTLIDNGHAYESQGDVYFDVRSYSDYGQLSGQKLDDLQSASDSEFESRKRDVRDFTLWKGAKPGEPQWPTPWGPGRPGWHLECSAMARAYLGDAFDIHGGGRDLVFPHHENEIAQSRAAGYDFAHYWLHNAWVTTSGEKMGKSLGNALVVDEVLKKVRPVELRWYLIGAHYRSNLEFSDAALEESASSFCRVENFVLRATEKLGSDAPTELRPVAELSGFTHAMNDDLGVPAALAILHDSVTSGNSALASGSTSELYESFIDVRTMLDVLGVDPLCSTWSSDEASRDEGELREALDHLIKSAIEEREQARANKDFEAADAIRDRIADAGISIEDSSDGARWSVRGNS